MPQEAELTQTHEPILYPSGWKWVYAKGKPENKEYDRWNLYADSGGVAATVYCFRNENGHNWFVWDEDGCGGENSCEPTIEAAMITAESATLRWGRF